MVGESEKESKNAKRKAQRLQRLKESRKAHRRAKKDLAKQKRKETQTNPDHHREPDSIHVSKKVAKNEAIERLKNVQSNPESNLKICIDLQYEELMNDKA